MKKIFTIGKLVVQCGWAKSGTWAITTEKEQRVHFISIHTVKQLSTGNKALSIILGPVSITMGIAK